jgi:hypothetical protein
MCVPRPPDLQTAILTELANFMCSRYGVTGRLARDVGREEFINYLFLDRVIHFILDRYD